MALSEFDIRLASLDLPSLIDFNLPRNADFTKEELAARIDLARILLIVQEHAATHTFTCFKNRNMSTSCRMKLPAPVLLEPTSIDLESYSLKIERQLGCNYLNKTNLALALLLRCNTDLMPLVMVNNGLVHYITSYAIFNEICSLSAVSNHYRLQ